MKKNKQTNKDKDTWQKEDDLVFGTFTYRRCICMYKYIKFVQCVSKAKKGQRFVS